MCNALSGQKRVSDVLEQEFQMVVSAMWVLGPENGSSEEQQVLFFTSEIFLQPQFGISKGNSESSLCLRIFVGQPSSTSLDV